MDVTVRVNGRVRIVDGDALKSAGYRPAGSQSGRNAGLIQGLVLDIDEAYFHCPRSFQFAELWDADTIATNRVRSLKDLLSKS